MREEQKRIWEYFTEMALRAGTQSNGKTASYSVAWMYQFYQDDYTRLNEITRAFLGDTDPALLPDTPLGGLHINDYLVEPNPNAEQEKAIQIALTKPVSFIQGPPGTGKSRTILNIMSCIVNGLQGSVAMVSANNAAVEVIAEKINGYKNPENGIAHSVLNNRAALHDRYAELGNFSKKIPAFNEKHPDMAIETAENSYGVKVGSNISFARFSGRFKAITSTIHSLKKLFSDGPNLQFDYVIIDESSQVNPMLGIIAMTSAKHLVLVGDQYQLPPIISYEDARELENLFPTVSDPYLVMQDVNGNMPGILSMCMKRFRDVNAYVMLKEHFRCHPGIIEFCNCNVYHKALRIKTVYGPLNDTLDYKVPIKVRWYQGDYCEKVNISENDKSDITKRNGKQETIFVREELPGLIMRLMDEHDTMDSFSVLSPFTGVLKCLSKKIEESLTPTQRSLITVKFNEPNDNEDDDSRIPFTTLTVYKSQGREYDVIYLLPAEDLSWERPWSQGRNLVNVAVSRAKEELRIIVSTSLMSELMQKTLTGAKTPIPEVPNPPENFRFVQKLIDYVKIANESDADYKNEKNVWDPDGLYTEIHDVNNAHHLKGIPFTFPISSGAFPVDFGFAKSNVESIFDAIPVVRRDAREVADENESPLQCLINAIFSIPAFTQEKMNLYTDVMLCDLQRQNADPIVSKNQIWEALESAGHKVSEEQRAQKDRLELHMDLVLCNSNKQVLLMIELDGAFHRHNDDELKLEKQKIYDHAKDVLMQTYYPDIPFLRIKTDGTGSDERAEIDRELSQRPSADVYCFASAGQIDQKWLDQKPLWTFHADGASWRLTRSPNTYPCPKLEGRAAGLLRHYGVKNTGEIYMDTECLSRFHP